MIFQEKYLEQNKNKLAYMADKPQENKDVKPNPGATEQEVAVPPASAEMQQEAAALSLQANKERAERKVDREKAKSQVEIDKFRREEKLPDVAGKENPPSLEIKLVKYDLEAPDEAKNAAAPDAPKEKAKEGVKLVIPPLNELDEAIKNDFIKRVDDRTASNEIDRLDLNVKREATMINEQPWNMKVSTVEGVDEVYSNFDELGILNNDKAFYDRMFGILRNGADESKNGYLRADSKYRVMFMDPASNHDKIADLPPKDGFFGGEIYMKAFAQLQYIQGIIKKQYEWQVATAEKQEKQGKDSLASGVVDALKDNINTFREAIKKKDYATAGLYAVGVWAIYKSYQKLTDGKDKFKDKLIYAAAAYCGYEFAKNAGYDILKMAGVKDADYDVKGTPMEIMQRILSNNPSLKEETKDLEYDVVLKMADAPLQSLNTLYDGCNKAGGLHFIGPEQFPELFPDNILRAAPSKTGLAIALNDSKAMTGENLGPDQREYIRLGQQIYKLAAAMRGAYEGNLMNNEKQDNYFKVPYETALTRGTRSFSKVRHLMSALDDTVGRPPGESLFGKKNLDKVRGDMGEAFKNKPELGLWITDKIADGQFEGHLMGMPVIFVMSEDGKSYKAYLKNKYGSKQVPGPNYMAEIPVEMGSKRDIAVDAVESNVKMRMAELLGPISVNGGAYSAPRYEHGKWVADVTLPGIARFDINATPIRVNIVVNSDGKGINIVNTQGGVRINLDEEVGKQYPLGISLAPRITDQAEFRALKIFSNAAEFKVISVNEAAGTVKVELGKHDLPVEFTYDSGTKKFSVNAAAEEALVRNPAFGGELTDSLKRDENFELNKNAKELKDLIEGSCSESFVMYFFKSLVGSGRNDQLGGINADVLSGSIPENFTNMIIDTSRVEVMERFRHAITGAKTLAEVEHARRTVLQDFNDSMVQILDSLKASNAELKRKDENWDRDRFMSEVVGRIRGASAESGAYTLSRSSFEYMVYAMDLPGVLTEKSDLSNESHSAAAKMMGVYAYYTAHLDNPEFTYKINGVDTKVKVDLDHLTYPPVATPGIADTKLDPNFEGHYINQYLEYVQNTVVAKAQAAGNLENLPEGSANGFWQIEEYEQWKQHGVYEPLDSLDQKPKFEHDPAKHVGVPIVPDDPATPQNEAVAGVAPEHTELDLELLHELDKAKDLLMDEYGEDVLDYAAMTDYLRKPDFIDGNAVDEDQIGLFRIYLDDAGNPKSKLWEISNRIALAAGNKRSVQTKLIRIEVDKFIRKVFEEKAERGLRFFIKQPSWSTELVMKWPWLRHILK